MKKIKHTPTPWFKLGSAIVSEDGIEILKDEDIFIPNLEFIIHVANSYEFLKNAVLEAEGFIKYGSPRHKTKILKILEKALAIAAGKIKFE